MIAGAACVTVIVVCAVAVVVIESVSLGVKVTESVVAAGIKDGTGGGGIREGPRQVGGSVELARRSGQCRRAIGPGASQAIAGVAGVTVIVVCAVAVV